MNGTGVRRRREGARAVVRLEKVERFSRQDVHGAQAMQFVGVNCRVVRVCVWCAMALGKERHSVYGRERSDDDAAGAVRPACFSCNGCGAETMSGRAAMGLRDC